MCFYPDTENRPVESCTNYALNNILASHVAAGRSVSGTRSIAYYDFSSRRLLGGADLSVSPQVSVHNGSDTVVCTTGIVNSRHFHTVCRYALSDNDFKAAALSNVQSCRAVHGYDTRVVGEECCGPPRSVCPTTPLSRMEHGGAVVAFALLSFVVVIGLRQLAETMQVHRRVRLN